MYLAPCHNLTNHAELQLQILHLHTLDTIYLITGMVYITVVEEAISHWSGKNTNFLCMQLFVNNSLIS